MNTQEQAAFDQAVELIRVGASSLAVADTLESQFLGLDFLMIRQIVGEAGGYVQKLQEQAFDASVEAFKRGETRIEVEAKLRKLDFHPYDAEQVAGRAQQKAQATDTPKAETPQAEVVVNADVALRREQESTLEALDRLSRTYAVPKI